MARHRVVSRTYGANDVFINQVELPLQCEDGSVYEKMLTTSRNPNQGRTTQPCRVSRRGPSLMVSAYEDTIIPSCMETIRSACDESLSLWVTMTNVVPRERFN